MFILNVMKDFYLSLSNCKKLEEWGCEIKGSKMTVDYGRGRNEELNTYHLLEDICVKHAKEFFGKEYTIVNCWIKLILPPPLEIISLLQQGAKELAENVFMTNTIFNPQNKCKT